MIVIGALALATMLLLAMFSLTESEYKATQNYVAGLSAKQFADVATEIVKAQIQNGQNTKTAASDRTIHATQPGMVRVYKADASFAYALKLYSSATMKINGPSETAIFSGSTLPPANWDQRPAQYVDLNEPVVRAALSGAGAAAVYYPVIDPRAYYNFVGAFQPRGTVLATGTRTTQVEGFSYDKKTATAGATSSVSYDTTVKTPSDVTDPAQLRLPMPVEWFYILQDGTIGTLDGGNNFVSTSGGSIPSAENPMVSRVAFWTDDESCKININTASEPTFFAPPYYYHERDRRWANFPAAAFEYQRYPGHPATVALSSVLAPNMRLDPLRPQDDGLTSATAVAEIKDYIYDMAPKVAMGGSKAGTIPFITDDFSNVNGEGTATTQAINNASARAERLYASVDEMLFKDGAYGAMGRVATEYDLPGSGVPLFDHDVLERSRFFLTAHSRSPEFSIFGLPRVCMWPVADSNSNEQANNPRRTNFDNMIALCATIGSGNTGAGITNSYFFRRAEPHHATYDVTGSATGYPGSTGLQRNSRLLEYLVKQMTTLVWPQTGNTGNNLNYATKYGDDNVKQLAVQFFDYIRCTNLYDSVLSRGNDGMSASGKSNTALYQERDARAPQRLTYTEQRVTPAATNIGANAVSTGKQTADDSTVLPGHGQVTPATWSTGGKVYKGFGRMFTISEIGISVICTADGKKDEVNGVFFPGATQFGGGTAFRADPQVQKEEPAENEPKYSTNAAIYPQFSLYKDDAALLSQNPNSRASEKAVWWSNFPPLTPASYPPAGQGPGGNVYGVNDSKPYMATGPQMNLWHPSRHPGYDPMHWNYTLPVDTPLADNEKRVQAMLMLETFCPMLGWTKMYPEYTVVLDGNYVAGITLNGTPLFDTVGDLVVKSNGNLYESTDVYSSGGHAGPTAFSGNRAGRPVSGQGDVRMGSDGTSATPWESGNTSGHKGLTNFPLTSNFITVNRDDPMLLQFPNSEFRITLYDSHNWETRQPIQIIRLRFDDGSGPIEIPAPKLVYNNYPYPEGKGETGGNKALEGRELNYTTYYEGGQLKYRRSVQGPHWWVYNYSGALGRATGRVNPNYPNGTFWSDNPSFYPPGAADTPIRQMLRGRLDTSATAQFTPPGAAQGITIFPPEKRHLTLGGGVFESDATRTLVPAVGDYRIVAALYDVPASMWVRHPLWAAIDNHSAKTEILKANRSIHTFSTYWATTESGYDLPPPGDKRLLTGQIIWSNPNAAPTSNDSYTRVPDLPETRPVTDDSNNTYNLPEAGWAKAANSFGDFDTGIANAREGPYINKPDEGNFFASTYTRFNRTLFYRSGYFYDAWKSTDDWRSGVFMTPNRMISSPVMFGSLPTGVFDTGGNVTASALTGSALAGTFRCRPWQTLLFRPYVRTSLASDGGKAAHPGDSSPKDHFLLDMFFMPVVEPYAISEPLSVAGRINMNYQIMPFLNIHRATGLHAVMKGEFITAIPDGDAYNAKTFKSQVDNPKGWDSFYGETGTPVKYWHRPINVDETLVQFDERFRMGVTGTANGLFRSASQICEMHLIPDVRLGASGSSGESLPTLKGLTAASRTLAMSAFWQNHKATGENIRERPYSNLYARLTTRSNTFRVHVRSQVIKKARSTNPSIFDADRDSILSEYRGSTLIERYIDPADTTIPDYGAAAAPLSLPPLDTFYKFRVVETKRFNP